MPYWIVRHFEFYQKPSKKAFQVKQIVWFPQDLTHRIFRPSLTKAIIWILKFCFRLPVAANQIQTRQTGREPISLRCIDVSMPNLVDGLMTPSWAAISSPAMLLSPPIAACSYILYYVSGIFIYLFYSFNVWWHYSTVWFCDVATVVLVMLGCIWNSALRTLIACCINCIIKNPKYPL